MKTVTKYLRGIVLAGGLAYATSAAADDTPAPETSAPVAEVLSAEDMNALAGGTGVDVVTITEQTLTAVNSGNVVTGDTVGSGDANIAANAFSGYSGVGNFVINTGHNNNLQSSLNVSIVLAPVGTP